MLRQLEFVLMLAHHIASSLGFVWSQTPHPHSLLVWLQSMKLCVCFLGWWAVGELRLPKDSLFWTPSPYGWASQVRLEGKRKGRTGRVKTVKEKRSWKGLCVLNQESVLFLDVPIINKQSNLMFKWSKSKFAKHTVPALDSNQSF